MVDSLRRAIYGLHVNGLPGSPARTESFPPSKAGSGDHYHSTVEPGCPPTHASRSGIMLGQFVRRAVAFLKEESGPTAVEYAVMLALILVAIVAAVSNIGTTTSDMYNNVALQGVKVK